jgi:endonuclease/exonuclease/phosphatase family metal-dependent hydrolase
MRIATFNILSGRSPEDDQVDEERYRRAIHLLDADLLGLQEVDRNQPRSRHADLTAIAADVMGAAEHRFVAALAGTPGATWSAATGDEQPDSAAYGVAFLSRYPVLGWRTIRLPGAPVPVPHRFHGRRLPTWVRDEPRVAVVAEVDSPRGRLDVVTTHLSFLRPWNGRQLRLLLAGLDPTPNPVLLMGDLNMGPGPAGRISRMRSLAQAPTFPAPEPREQIDHILTNGGMEAEGEAVRLPMSDHRALVALL